MALTTESLHSIELVEDTSQHRHLSSSNPATPPTSHGTATAVRPHAPREGPQSQRSTKQLRRMLLLNGYPILYIVLWIPGIANRICEAVGLNYTWLSGLQASTQFMGVCDVLTYAYNEQLGSRIRATWQNKRGRSAISGT
jgi:hypothetical protein